MKEMLKAYLMISKDKDANVCPKALEPSCIFFLYLFNFGI